MSHEIDTTTGQTAIAYIQGSETPWHGLGQTVDPGAPIDTWKKAAGLDWEAKRAEVTYQNEATGQVATVCTHLYKCLFLLPSPFGRGAGGEGGELDTKRENGFKINALFPSP